jgi:hypothetical protein
MIQIVMPAQAGIQGRVRAVGRWTPAFSGVTIGTRNDGRASADRPA